MAKFGNSGKSDVVSLAISTTGTAGDDILIGTNDYVTGDVLDGGAGNDYLDGLGGADTLTGGTGADTFKIHNGAMSNATYGMDTITDFSAEDFVDLTNIRNYSGADHMDVRQLN